jgi:putative membrane protein
MIFKWLITALALLLISRYLPGFHIDSFYNALIAALIIGLLNVIVRPILILLTLPITFFTLGLFLLVINALMIQLASTIVKGFSVDSFWVALLAAIILAVIGVVADKIFKPSGRVSQAEIIN